MSGKDALKEIQNLISDAKAKGKTPTKVLIPSKYENALLTIESGAVGNEVKSIITKEGVQAAFPKINGIETEWNADVLKLKY